MDYDTAILTVVSREQARQEVARHDGEDWDAFLAEVGDKPDYTGAEVLGGLGY